MFPPSRLLDIGTRDPDQHHHLRGIGPQIVKTDPNPQLVTKMAEPPGDHVGVKPNHVCVGRPDPPTFV